MIASSVASVMTRLKVAEATTFLKAGMAMTCWIAAQELMRSTGAAAAMY
ncbi:MAG: hypothetical protein ACJAVT_001397 [Yoonia sp.]|jgi:hypothetical protein